MSVRSKFLSLLGICIFIAAGAAGAIKLRSLRPSVELSTGTLLVPRRALADFSLIDNQGRGFGPANLRGHWSLMFFGYTNCPDFCPATLTTLAALEKRLRADQFPPPRVIFVSVDAKRDTPEQLAKYVPYFDPEFIGVTAADQPAIESIARQWGVIVSVQPSKDGNYTVDHSGAIFVLDADGRLAAILTGPFSVDALRADLLRIESRGA